MKRQRRWDAELAARLLQYGVSGQMTADIVGATQPEISKYRDQLMGMVVEPLSRHEAEELERQGKAKRAARKMQKECAEIAQCPAVVEENATVAEIATVEPDNNTNEQEEKEKENMEEMKREPVVVAAGKADEAPMVNYPPEEVKPATEPLKPDIVVDIVLGKGKGEVHLSAADVHTLGTIISMLEAVFRLEGATE